QLKQVPLPSNSAFPLAMLSGVEGIGFLLAFASEIWSAGTRGLSGSFSSAPTTETDSIISAALIPRNLAKYPIRLPPLCLTTAREFGIGPLANEIHVKATKRGRI